jgi:hypothetical protein
MTLEESIALLEENKYTLRKSDSRDSERIVRVGLGYYDWKPTFVDIPEGMFKDVDDFLDYCYSRDPITYESGHGEVSLDIDVLGQRMYIDCLDWVHSQPRAYNGSKDAMRSLAYHYRSGDYDRIIRNKLEFISDTGKVYKDLSVVKQIPFGP